MHPTNVLTISRFFEKIEQISESELLFIVKNNSLHWITFQSGKVNAALSERFVLLTFTSEILIAILHLLDGERSEHRQRADSFFWRGHLSCLLHREGDQGRTTGRIREGTTDNDYLPRYHWDSTATIPCVHQLYEATRLRGSFSHCHKTPLP
jgi:hypothetical protein